MVNHYLMHSMYHGGTKVLMQEKEKTECHMPPRKRRSHLWVLSSFHPLAASGLSDNGYVSSGTMTRDEGTNQKDKDRDDKGSVYEE